MLPQQRKGWTTVTDIEQFKKMTWCYLTNVKMMWQYQGMAYLFRKEGISLYGKDLGTMKTNHPIACMAIPQSKDKNYGVDIYVPVSDKKRAEKIIADQDRIRECAQLEVSDEAKKAHMEFNRAALAAKQRNADAKKASRAERRSSLIARLAPGFLADKG